MIETKVVTLTPEIARAWREKNVNNFRKINSHRVNQYASEISAGNWKLNGETICFDEDGALVNGQHRIEAVIKANMPVEVLVVYGVKRDDCIYDSGLSRTTLQSAKQYGVTVNNAKLASVNFILNESANNNYHGKIELIEYYQRNARNYDLAYNFSIKGSHNPLMKKAGCIAAIYCAIVLNLLSYDEMDAFCSIVNSGMPIDGYANEAAIVLRNMFISGINMRSADYIAWCFDITYQAMERFKAKLKKKTKYSALDFKYKEIIPRVKNIEYLIARNPAV